MTWQEKAYNYVKAHEGCTMPQLAWGLRLPDDPTYGRQRKASNLIAALRRKGLVSDVAERCKECGAARTRGTRGVKLFTLK
jgi:hypothetical protein